MRQKFLFILALLLTAVTGAWAQDEWATVYMQTQTTSANWTALEASSTGRTLGSSGTTTYHYATGDVTFTNSNAGGSGLTILGTVYLYVPEGVTVTCIGANANGTTGAGAGVELSLGNSLYFLGSGTVNATGGNAANGGNGGKGDDATGGNGSWTQTGAGGNGGNGGGGAGAGIGTRGGAGGSGGAGGGGNYYNDGKQDDAFGGTNGTSGSAGATAGAMGALYVSNAITVSATGGHAGSSGGSGGQRGRGYAYDGYSYNVTVAGGGGGGGGGFGGAASNIGTGGPGGGGGGGGAGGAQDWRPNSKGGVYDVTAPGGHGGQNANGGYAGDGTEAGTNGTAQSQGWVTVENGSFDSDDWNPASGDAPAGTAGNGGGKGGNTTAGSAVNVNMEWTSLQEDDWGMVCLLTQTSRANWTLLTDGSQTGMTLGEAGKTTYYYTMIDRFFTNSNAGGSGLTILGTVYLYIPSGKQITCTGINAIENTGGGAGIELTAGNTLYIIGGGTLNATGGNAANGGNAGNGGNASFSDDEWVRSGAGGNGGYGGGGAGAGIGSRGGNGGAGGSGGAAIQTNFSESSGNAGGNGGNGATAGAMGTLYVYQAMAPQVVAQGGSAGTTGGNRGTGGLHALDDEGDSSNIWTMGGGAGGAGGGFGGAASNIGTGGPGGGGGGGGSAGTIQSDDSNAGFYQVGAKGGNPGTNADGTPASDAAENTLLDRDDESLMAQRTHLGSGNDDPGTWEEIHYYTKGWQNGDNRASGGTGGTAGAATTAGSANNVTLDWPTSGKGTEGDPVIISSAADWNNFVTSVNNGANCSGTYLKLTADISVTTMVGTSDANSFQGTFLGNGNTLTFTKGTDAEPFAEEYCAPFRHVKNAVIKNLHVDGTIYTNQKKAAGIVGESLQNLSIIGCRSSIAINSSTVTDNDNHDGTHGGFVGTLSGENNTVTIDGCVFDGSFATTNGTINCGGFIGWVTYNKPTITNSLMAPASVGAGMVANTFSRWHTGYEPTITNCYYVATDNLPTNQGMEAVANALLDIGSLVQDYGMVKAYEHGIFYNGTYYVDPDMVSDFRLLSTATAQDVGKVVCAAGHLHDAKRAVPDGCTAVGVLGKVTSTGHGLILALQDAASQTWNTINGWESVTGYAGTTLKLLPNDNARGNLASYTSLGVVAVSDWCVAQKGDYDAIFTNLGSTTGDNNGKTRDASVNAYITNAGGAAFNKTGGYWSATEYSSENGWFFGEYYWYYSRKTNSYIVRPVLGFAASAITITLADNADNGTTISNADGYLADVTLADRTLYKDGAWNTICLPFDVTLAGSPLAGATARPLTSASISGSTLTLTFGDAVTTLKAGTPYIIKWTADANYVDDDAHNIVSPVFSGVTIDADADGNYDTETASPAVTTDERVRFLGTYKSTTFDAEDKSILLMGGANKLYYPLSGASLGAQRAYFKIGEVGGSARQITDFDIDFGEQGTQTVIGHTDITDITDKADAAWYSLDGRKLEGKPTKKGVYIHNGRVVVK